MHVDGMEEAGGLCVYQCKARGQDLSQNLKSSVHGSVLGTPCETAVWGGTGR